MTFVKRNRARVLSVLALLLCALTMFSACQEPQQSIPGSVDSISVRVMDGMDSKTITPEGNVNISHYVITVVNEAEDINQSSGYLTKGSMFTVSNVPAGTWYAKVDAYIQRGEEGSYTYVKVASDQSEPKTVQAGASTTFELVLDTLDAVASGDVTVTFKMPAALSAESTAFWYQYTITGMTDEEFTHTSALLSGTTGADGLATITLDADAIGLMQGAYRFAITVQDAETSPSLTRKGMDVMRLVNGLEAKGTIDLTTYEADQSFNVTITDKIGDILTPTLQNGQEVYNLDGQDGSASLTVTLAEPLKASETIEWYVDGELDETVNTDEAASGKYTLTFTPGSHIVTAIVRDTDTLMAVGSIDELKVMIVAEFVEQVFTFRLNRVNESYIVTGLAAPIGEFEMPKSGVLEIPATYKGKPVLSIGERAFEGRTDIVGSVVIPDGVTSIGFGAFSSCSSLESINIPDGVTEIGEQAFYGCSSLETVEISEAYQLTLIGSNAFYGCSALTNITIPDGVTSIGYSAFYGCSSLETVEFSDASQLILIGSGAFSGCSSLTNITIPDGVTSIESTAFHGCSALTNITIPNGVTSIKQRTFSGCSSLESITIPEGVTSIEFSAFSGCSSLTSFTIPDGVTEIGESAFSGCSAITSINIPDGVTSIGSSAFGGCSSLETVKISEASQLTLIRSNAFYGCSALTSFTIPEGVTSIERRAFYDCSGLTSITIPDGVISIGSGAFWSCSALTDIYCEAASQPEGWDAGWKNGCHADVFWGVPRSEYDAIMNNGSVSYTVPEPVISYEAGHEMPGIVDVSIICDKTFAHIYYTIDGADPTANNGTLYETPFSAEIGQTIRAVAYVGNGIYSEVVTKLLS